MENLAEQLRNEIKDLCDNSTRSFLDRKQYVINTIRGGKREVHFILAKSYDRTICAPTKEKLLSLGMPEGWRLDTTYKTNDGVYYRNGKHYLLVVKRADTYPNSVIDQKEICIEDVDGIWKCNYLYSHEELLDLGDYFERNGFEVSINRCSDHYSRYYYKTDFFNIDNLIISL